MSRVSHTCHALARRSARHAGKSQPHPPLVSRRCVRRNTEARARKQQAWELLSAFAAKLDGVSGPLSRAAEALAREHEARAAAQARLSGNEKAKAVWIGILASEVRMWPMQLAILLCGGRVRPVRAASECSRIRSLASAWAQPAARHTNLSQPTNTQSSRAGPGWRGQ